MQPAQRIPLLLSLGLIAAVLTSCGGDDSGGSDSSTSGDGSPAASTPAPPGTAAGVCEGETFADAPPYEKGSAQVTVFTDAGEGDGYEFSSYSTELPDSASALVPEDASVIVCMEVTDSKVVETCEFEDSDSGEKFNQEKADATYDVRALVAATGEELFSTELSAEATDCGLIASFTPGEGTSVDYAKPADELAKQLQPITGT